MRTNRPNARVRAPAVAGLFYPDDEAELRESVQSYLAGAPLPELPKQPSGFIVPHAGYVYSGSTAAVAYRTLAAAPQPRRVVLIGPSHRVYLEGVAVPRVDAFATPLGMIEIDPILKREIQETSAVIESDEPHRYEHSLEVQLPFLQVIFGEFTLLPLVAGDASAAHVASILDRVSRENDVVILASSDLSHYLTYDEAQEVDARTNDLIVKREPTLSGSQACGAVPINGLLQLARLRGLAVRELARCNSGDTAGARSRVVGYGAYAVYEA